MAHWLQAGLKPKKGIRHEPFPSSGGCSVLPSFFSAPATVTLTLEVHHNCLLYSGSDGILSSQASKLFLEIRCFAPTCTLLNSLRFTRSPFSAADRISVIRKNIRCFTKQSSPAAVSCRSIRREQNHEGICFPGGTG